MMGIVKWKRKWDAFRAELARRNGEQPRLTLVIPKRASGEHVTPRNWYEPEQQRKLFGCAVCANCGLAQLPGAAMHQSPRGPLCGECAILLDAEAEPPAA